MSTSTKTLCCLCEKIKVAYLCPGCLKHFCFDHLSQHRREIEQQFDQLQNNHDQIRQQISDLKADATKHPLIKQIDQWELDSINKIKQQAQLCKIQFIGYSSSFLRQTEEKLNHLAQQIREVHQENAFNEDDFNHLRQALEKLEKELNQPTNVSIKQQSTSFIQTISLHLPIDLRWKQYATTVVGGNGPGHQLNQLHYPQGVSFDDQNQIIYTADWSNHRIVEWKLDTNKGRLAAGGNGKGNRLDQLNGPADVIIDRQNNHLIVADFENRRVMRWSRYSNSPPEILIDNIDCARVAMDADGSLYVSDFEKHEVKRWKKRERHGTVVAGGNGQGSQLNQFYHPTCLFIDHDRTLYVSDRDNHRVMKWIKDAKQGIVVAGGNGEGNQLSQLSHPGGIIVDQSGQIYVADRGNNRIMRWCEGKTQGTVVVGGNGAGEEKNQFNYPVSLSFDGEGNLFVTDHLNHRIQKFERDFD